MILIKKFEFEAAHRLIEYNGKCENLHGHTYKLVIKIDGNIKSDGMVFDFVQLGKIIKEEVINILDHSYLNDIIKQPTAENIAIWIWDKLFKKFEDLNIRLYEIELWETNSSGVIYRGDCEKNK